MRVARVRVIFRLPDTVLQLEKPLDLAFVEWFTEFDRQPQTAARMFKVRKALRLDKSRETEVVSVDHIVRSCQLIPVWERDLDGVISPEEVLDRFEWFHVNDFLDPHAYLSL